MPLYQYECTNLECRAAFDAMNPMRLAASPKSCPRCDSIAERVYAPCNIETDATVYSTKRTDGHQFSSEAMRNFYLGKARAAGINPTGKTYDYQLANYPGDPRAWIGSDSDLRQVLEERGWGSKGKVKVGAKHDGPGERPKGGLSEKNVRQLVHERMVVDPGQKLSRVVEDVVNDHAPRGAKRIIKTPKKRTKK
jgi:putative FmdB family regulatory protein